MPRPAANVVKRLRDGVDRSLFPPSPPGTGTHRRWETGVLVVSFLALAIVLQLFRLGPSSALNSLWAEDGTAFLDGALRNGFIDDVTDPYAEYLVVVPRLLGEIGAAVPLNRAAAAMNLAAVVVIAISGLAVWFAAAGHIRNPYLRALLVALAVLCPVSTIEAVASPTNVAWYMAFAVFWLLLWRPATTWGACLGGLFILATGLSTPATLFFIPIALLRAIAIRGIRDAVIVGAFGLGLAIQVPAMSLNTEDVATPLWTTNIFTSFLQRVVDSAVLGVELGGSTWAYWGWPFVIGVVVAFAAYLAAMLLRVSSGRLVAAIAVATSAAMFLTSAYSRGGLADAMVWNAGEHINLGGRYAIGPTLLLVSAALVLVDARYRSSRDGPPVAAVAVAAVLLVSLVTSFDVRGETGRGGPPWDQSVGAASAECQHLPPSAEVRVGISPGGWTMLVPCHSVPFSDSAGTASTGR